MTTARLREGEMMQTITEKRALAILHKHGPMRAMAFAHEMWPDSPSWLQMKTCGNGAHGVSRGLGMLRAAAGYLGKLRRKGLVRSEYPPDGGSTRWILR
mgnify:CR=1 FL=1